METLSLLARNGVWHSCTMWYRQFTKYVTKYDHKVWCHPHSTEYDTQPIAYLISKQVVPYQTRGDTYCPRVSAPKIRSLADSSMTNHITWRNLTVFTIPTLLKPHHRSLTRSNHISVDGKLSPTKTHKVQKWEYAKGNSPVMSGYLQVRQKSRSPMRNNDKTSAIDCGGYRLSFDVILFPMVRYLASHDRHVV
jgi:hypothetical protein